jgi:hypothetical protein
VANGLEPFENLFWPVILEKFPVLGLETGFGGLHPPPSSLRKPHVSGTTPNRAFLRGFSATQFPAFGLYGRSWILVAVFGALSPHPKIPFPAVGPEREVRARFAPVIRDRGRALQFIPD